MNNLSRILLSALGALPLAASCTGPLAFQDPLTARQSPSMSSQRRFGSRPVYREEGQVAPADADYGLQPSQRPQLDMPGRLSSGIQAHVVPSPAASSPLMGWEGQVINDSGEGQTRLAQGPSKHGLEPQISGRTHILNLYQEVLDERDSLLLELERLNSALREGEQLLTQLRSSEKAHSQRLAALEEIKRTLIEQNRDLSSRLTVAQIRRLESDKLLLETQIAMHSNTNDLRNADVAEPMLLTEK